MTPQCTPRGRDSLHQSVGAIVVESPGPLSLVRVGAPEPELLRVETAVPALVLEADRQRAEAFKAGLEGLAPSACTVCAEVLTATPQQLVDWHSYNDSRMDGPLALQHWQGHYPNLKLMGRAQRQGRTLEQVLTAWVAQLEQPVRALQLELAQGDPLAALQGLGPWLQAVQQVRLAMPGSDVLWGERIGAWLGAQGFRQTAQRSCLWQRDPLASLQLALQARERRLAELEEQLSCQAVRLLLAQEQADSLRAEKHGLEEQLADREQQLTQIDVELDQVLALLST